MGYISPTAEFTPNTVQTPDLRTRLVYQARVYVCNPRNELRLGMPATVTIHLGSAACRGWEGRPLPGCVMGESVPVGAADVVLSCRDLSKRFLVGERQIQALEEVSVDAHAGRINRPDRSGRGLARPP